MNAQTSSWKVGLPLAVATAMQWAVVPILGKGLLHTLDPQTLTWYRQIGCALPMALFFLWQRPSWAGLRDRRALKLLAICVIGLAGNAFFFNAGLNYATPSATQMIAQLGPVLTLLGAVLLFKESFTRRQWSGTVAIVGGLGLFFHSRIADLTGLTGYGIGLLLLAFTPLFWSSYALAQKRLGRRLETQQVLIIAYVIGTLLFLPVSTPTQALALDGLGMTLLLGTLLLYLFSYVTLGLAMNRWEASRVSAMLTLTPLFTLFFSAITERLAPGYIAAEPIGLLNLLGAALVVGGSLIIALPRRRYAAA